MTTEDTAQEPESDGRKAERTTGDLRHDITDMIGYALWRHWKLRPPERDLAATKRWAAYVTAHLELCGIEWTRKPPTKNHSDTNF